MKENSARIGLQLSADGAQVTWQSGPVSEPRTLSLPGERDDGMMDVPPEVWRQILTAKRDERSGEKEQTSLSPAAAYLSGLFSAIPSRSRNLGSFVVCVTLPQLTEGMADQVKRALMEIGIEERNVFLQDFRTSFYYYVVNKNSSRNGDVAFLTMKNEEMKGYILHFDRLSPVHTAVIHEEASCDVSARARDGRSQQDWDQERDRLLYELLGRLFERRNVTVSYLYGTYFDAGWAKRSFQYLTFHRKAYQGQNLFSKGACYGAMARLGLIRMPDITFIGTDMVRISAGMNVRIRGKMAYYPLIREGVNWYEAHGMCEVIPDGDRNVTILTCRKDDPAVLHVLRLDHAPDRPSRATRLRVAVWFSAPGKMEMEVTDLGFGSLFPASGMVWRRSIRV